MMAAVIAVFVFRLGGTQSTVPIASKVDSNNMNLLFKFYDYIFSIEVLQYVLPGITVVR